jgi:hypothetical protein
LNRWSDHGARGLELHAWIHRKEGERPYSCMVKGESLMAQLAPLSPTDLRYVLARQFDEEELRTLCFDLGAEYDFESLRGEGKRAKARELVALAQRRGHLAKLEAAIRRERPAFDITFSYQRVKELQKSIMEASGQEVRDNFVEFTYQLEAYSNEFNLLHVRLEEWKEVHNMLQDLQISFAPCGSYVFTIGRLEGPAQYMASTGKNTLRGRSRMATM